ncbi:hypothetical protein ACVWZ4_007214 [Bradyrhizobium sp. USDA 4472]
MSGSEIKTLPDYPSSEAREVASDVLAELSTNTWADSDNYTVAQYLDAFALMRLTDAARSPAAVEPIQCGSASRDPTEQLRAALADIDIAAYNAAKTRIGWALEALDVTSANRRPTERKIDKWLSAALEDPNVCEEMKADIRDYFEHSVKNTEIKT